MERSHQPLDRTSPRPREDWPTAFESIVVPARPVTDGAGTQHSYTSERPPSSRSTCAPRRGMTW